MTLVRLSEITFVLTDPGLWEKNHIWFTSGDTKDIISHQPSNDGESTNKERWLLFYVMTVNWNSALQKIFKISFRNYAVEYFIVFWLKYKLVKNNHLGNYESDYYLWNFNLTQSDIALVFS